MASSVVKNGAKKYEQGESSALFFYLKNFKEEEL